MPVHACMVSHTGPDLMYNHSGVGTILGLGGGGGGGGANFLIHERKNIQISVFSLHGY